MKKFFLSAFFAAIFLSAFAQNDFTFGVKYTWLKPDNINRTVYTYNYTRQWLDQKMDYFGMLHGYEFTWQHRGESAGLEMGLERMGATNIATGMEPSSGLRGYRKIKVSTGGINFGATWYLHKSTHMEIAPAFDFNLIFFNVSTTYSNDAAFTGASETEVVSKMKVGNSFAINWTFFATKWLGINIRPYYQLPYGRVNVEGLMKELQGDDNTQREHIRNYGISASLDLAFGRD